ncbi:MAG: glycine cleavage system aminomethyltransferase GcvT [Candidatus Hodarchaeales archaeon]|jgi:aminomethyltransferase
MKTQLYEWHAQNGDIIDFAGFQMPVMYSSIKEEHMAVRTAAGLFDVSHMGRMWIEGSDAVQFLNELVPRDLKKTLIGKASYTFMLNEQGGFKDDLVFERIEKDKWLLVWNAGNLQKIELWIESFKTFLSKFYTHDISTRDISSSSAMFALQGPKSKEILSDTLIPEPPTAWSVISTSVDDTDIIISGTGYTGESGYEIIVLDTTKENPSKALDIWTKLLRNGESKGLKPCGLGARDSLRLEVGYPLYGNDIDEEVNPIEADLFFPPFIHMNKPNFFGKEYLDKIKTKSPNRKRVGLLTLKKGPSPRSGMKLFSEGQEIGFVTSGGYSPLLKVGVGMGYITTHHKKEDSPIQFELRGKHYQVKVANFPLFNPLKYGKTRKS